MKWNAFPERIKALEPFSGRFDAHRMQAEGCEIFFATYPAGTVIEPHSHDTDNWGVITKGEMNVTVDEVETAYGPGDWYHVTVGIEHAARCFVETEEIEFWFKEDTN